MRANSTPAMQEYHDTIWKPEYEDQQLFRKMVLDMNQAGLSWQTILNKMANFDAAYDQFEITKVANYTGRKVEELMMNQESSAIGERLKRRSAMPRSFKNPARIW